tara:strand:- start:245 stop:688 length:444 start_codon:yes stop_codon:yes gene_type:complete
MKSMRLPALFLKHRPGTFLVRIEVELDGDAAHLRVADLDEFDEVAELDAAEQLLEFVRGWGRWTASGDVETTERTENVEGTERSWTVAFSWGSSHKNFSEGVAAAKSRANSSGSTSSPHQLVLSCQRFTKPPSVVDQLLTLVFRVAR